MDPDQALRNLRQMGAELHRLTDADDSPTGLAVAEFLEQFEHLDSWLTAHGFLPGPWDAAQR